MFRVFWGPVYIPLSISRVYELVISIFIGFQYLRWVAEVGYDSMQNSVFKYL